MIDDPHKNDQAQSDDMDTPGGDTGSAGGQASYGDVGEAQNVGDLGEIEVEEDYEEDMSDADEDTKEE